MIEIVTIGEIERKLLEDLGSELAKAYAPLVEGYIIGPSLEMPPAAYNARRRQYDANIIIERVLHRIPSEKVLALTNYDLYTSSCNLNFIFGQAQCPGRVALVSLHRLDQAFYGQPPDDELFFERAKKEAIHELGHTFRLGHCSNPKCVMSFSNSILDVDRKSSTICESCRKKFQLHKTFTIRALFSRSTPYQAGTQT